MNKEHDEQLCRECPNLYADRHASMHETCMCWGFECDDGWFDLIFTLSRQIEAIISQMPLDERSNYKASQVKEKFGGLRFYMTGCNNEIEKLIEDAEYASERTCESCGKEGTLHTDGWWYTACDDCDAKRHNSGSSK